MKIRIFILLITFIWSSLQECPFPRQIWTYWSSQTQPTMLHRLFIQKMKKHVMQQKGWTVNFVSDSNAKNYLPNTYQDYIQKLNSFHQNIPAVRSDMLRLYLIAQNGGIWVDLTTIFLQDFEWLQNLKDDPNVINRDAQYSPEPDALIFHWKRYQYNNQYIGSDGNIKANSLGYECWFIGGKKGAPIIVAWKNKFIEYYKSNAKYIFNQLKHYDVYMNRFNVQTYLRSYFSIYQVIKSKQIQLDNQASLFYRMNANIHYKLWTIDCSKGPCFNYYKPFNEPNKFERLFYAENQQVMLDQYKKQPQYCIKYVRRATEAVNKLLSWFNAPQNQKKSLKQLYLKDKNMFAQCRFMPFVAQDSFMFKNLIKNNLIDNRTMSRFVSQNERNQFHEFCKQLQNNKPNAFILFLTYQKFFQTLASFILYGYFSYKILQFTRFIISNGSFTKNNKSNDHLSLNLTPLCPIDQICFKLDDLLMRITFLQIPYPIIAFLYCYQIHSTLWQHELNNFKQMYSETLTITVVCCFLHKFSRVHFRKSKLLRLWLLIHKVIQQFIYLCIAKLIAQLLFDNWLRIWMSTFFMGYLLPCIVQQSQTITNIPLINRINALTKNKHFFLVIIILSVVSMVPNLKYMRVQNQYVKVWLLRLSVIYGILLTIALIWANIKQQYLLYLKSKSSQSSKAQTILQQQTISKPLSLAFNRVLVAHWVYFLIFFYSKQYELTIYGKSMEQLHFFFSFTFIMCSSVVNLEDISNVISKLKAKSIQKKRFKKELKYSVNLELFGSMLLFWLVLYSFENNPMEKQFVTWDMFFGQKAYFLEILTLFAKISLAINILRCFKTMRKQQLIQFNLCNKIDKQSKNNSVYD